MPAIGGSMLFFTAGEHERDLFLRLRDEQVAIRQVFDEREGDRTHSIYPESRISVHLLKMRTIKKPETANR